MTYIQQHDSTDCGAACIAMIASYYGTKLNIAEVRANAGTDMIGTSLNGILLAAKNYKLKATAVKGTKNSITQTLSIPFIAHLHLVRESGKEVDHYVVVKQISKRYIEIWDPDPHYKKQKISYKNFFDWWTGYAVFMEPDIGFKKDDRERNIFLRFIPFFLPYKKILFYTFLCSLILLFFGIIISFYYKYLFDEIIYSKSKLSLNSISFGIFLVVILQGIIGVMRSFFLSHFSYKSELQLNFSYFSHIFNLPLKFFDGRQSGEILSRINDLDKIKQTITNSALSIIMDTIMVLISGPILAKINLRLFGISFVGVFLISLISFIFSKVFKKYYSKAMSQNADVQSYLLERLNGIETLIAFNAKEIMNNEYEKKKLTAINTIWELNKYKLSHEFISSVIFGIIGILIYWLGCSSIIDDQMSFGTLMTFNSLLVYFTNPIYRLLNISSSFQESIVAAERVFEILELEIEKEKNNKYLTLNRINGNIKFENVNFSYGTRKPIYEKLNFEIKPCCCTAFVGPSGCGKSTIAKLILKLYSPTQGKIFIDNIDIQDIETNCLRNRIGYVPQNVFLFSGSISDNICLYNQDANFKDVIEAAKKAGADKFIEKLPNRYNTILGENGAGLSGGEKQRIAIARALLGKPDLLILDEATSNLDSISELEIQKALKGLLSENISVILIAHRLTTIMNCDQIYVMENGQIIQQGTHNILINQNGLYKKMCMEANI